MTMSSPPTRSVQGGCQCGKVRYTFSQNLDGAGVCHCRMCQKANGGPFVAYAGADKSSFSLTEGTIKWFASSDFAERGFCEACGTPLTYRTFKGDRINVTLGSLDQPERFTPSKQFGIEARLSWSLLLCDLPEAATDDWLSSPLVSNQELI